MMEHSDLAEQHAVCSSQLLYTFLSLYWHLSLLLYSPAITYEITQPWDLNKFLESAAVDKENFDAVFDALKEDDFDDGRLGSLTTRYLKDIKIPNEEIPGILRAAKVWARPRMYL